jgi:hypothetical protein
MRWWWEGYITNDMFFHEPTRLWADRPKRIGSCLKTYDRTSLSQPTALGQALSADRSGKLDPVPNR